jgi:hypothetical protein
MAIPFPSFWLLDKTSLIPPASLSRINKHLLGNFFSPRRKVPMARWAKWEIGAILLALIWGGSIPTLAWAQQKPTLPPPASVLPPPVSKPSPGPPSPPVLPPTDLPKPTQPGSVVPAPEMTPYPYPGAERPIVDAKTLIQQRAAQEAAARNRRLAALRWFGYSNSRPVAGVDCIHGDYSPSWTSNNPHYPFRWVGAGPTWVAWLPAIATPR